MEYNGSILIHARDLEYARKMVNLNHVPKKEELQRFLSFLSVVTLANGLYYDSSVPYPEELEKGINDLKLAGTVTKLKISKYNELFNECGSAVQEAQIEFMELLEEPRSFQNNDRKIKEEQLDNFFYYIDALNNEKDIGEKKSISFEAFKTKNLMGGKLLIGLSNEKNSQILRKVALFSGSNNEIREIILSNLVSIFRTFLLSIWAERKGLLFSVMPKRYRIIERHKFRWFEFEKAIKENFKDDTSSLSSATNQEERPEVLPMLGLNVLLRADDNSRPLDLLLKAEEMAKETNIRSLQKELIKLEKKLVKAQINCPEKQDVIKEEIDSISGNIAEKIVCMDGPKFEKQNSFKHCIYPAFVGSIFAAGIGVKFGMDVKQTIVLSGIPIAVKSLELAVKELKNDNLPFVSAMSNLMAYDKFSDRAIQKKAESIWR